MSTPLTSVILAAGMGTRMKSNKAKVLHELYHRPMVHHVVNAITPLMPTQNIVVVGHQANEVQKSLTDFQVDFATQHEQLGTGHAVLCAEESVKADDGMVLILYGDTPLILTETLQAMVDQHKEQQNSLTLMTTFLDKPTGYGRIINNESGKPIAIVEQKDANDEERLIKEINVGIYCVDKNFLFDTLKNVGTQNSQGEIYLTDILAMAVDAELAVDKFVNPEPDNVLGVNSRIELAQAHGELCMRRNRELMLTGVSMIQPETIEIASDVQIGKDTTVFPGVTITSGSVVGEGCTLMHGTHLDNATLGDNVELGPQCYLKNVTLKSDSRLAPHEMKIA